MRILYKLLYSFFWLILLNTSLLANSNFTVVDTFNSSSGNKWVITNNVSVSDACYDAGSTAPSTTAIYTPTGGSGYVYPTNPHNSDSYCDTRWDWISVSNVDSCPDGTVLNGTICQTPPAPTCLDNQYVDSNNTCQDIAIPADFPQDANTSHGAYSNGYAPIPQSACDSTSSPDYSTTLGTYHIVGWDYGTQKCVALAFKCNSGFIYDSTLKTCTIPPETKTISPNSNTNDSANQCTGSQWGQTWTYNFCDKCQGDVGIWLPPVGLEGYGLECNKKYVEYQCTTDYRLKKFEEVSCGNVLPKDKTTKQIDLSNLDTTPTNDTNTSSLSAPDSTQAITTMLSKQIEQNKELNDKVATAEGQNKLLDGINALGDKLDSIKNGQLSQDGVKNGVKEALDDRDNNLSVPSDANETGPGGDGLGAAKNAILSQYGTTYDLFGVTTCGSPSFDPSITFMSMTIENPLPVMDSALSSYYPMFKSFFLIVATFLGLLSVFRR